MTSEQLRGWGDIALAVLVILGAAVLLIGSADLPPPRFEPLGSAALPRILGVILIFLALWMALRAGIRIYRAAPPKADTSEDAEAVLPGGRLMSFLLFVDLVAYVAAIDLMRVPFWLASGVFLGLAGLILSKGDWRAGAIYGALGAAIGGLLAWIFVYFLYISIG